MARIELVPSRGLIGSEADSSHKLEVQAISIAQWLWPYKVLFSGKQWCIDPLENGAVTTYSMESLPGV